MATTSESKPLLCLNDKSLVSNNFIDGGYKPDATIQDWSGEIYNF